MNLPTSHFKQESINYSNNKSFSTQKYKNEYDNFQRQEDKENELKKLISTSSNENSINYSEDTSGIKIPGTIKRASAISNNKIPGKIFSLKKNSENK